MDGLQAYNVGCTEERSEKNNFTPLHRLDEEEYCTTLDKKSVHNCPSAGTRAGRRLGLAPQLVNRISLCFGFLFACDSCLLRAVDKLDVWCHRAKLQHGYDSFGVMSQVLMAQACLSHRHVRKSESERLFTNAQPSPCTDNGCARDMPEVVHPGR